MSIDTSTPRALEGRSPAPRSTVVSWAMWDWGTQPFNSVIITFVFSVYLTSKSFGDTNSTSLALSTSTMVAGLIVALIAPVIGQSSDRNGTTVRDLRWLTWALALIAGLMFFVRPEGTPQFGGLSIYLILGLLLLGVGSIINEVAGVQYNSLIDEVATDHNVGKVSGFGWGMGYLGGIFSLLIIYFGFISPEVGLFGVTNADGLDIRVSMIVCAVWIVLFTIPTFRALHDRPIPQAPKLGAVAAYRALFASIKKLWLTDRNVLFFLAASALFRDGLTGVFAFGAPIAAGTFGFSAGQVIIFGVVANVVAGVSTIAFGLVDDRIGPKRVIMISLSCLTVLGLGVFIFHDGGPVVFWILGLALSAFVGPAQSASRSFLARLVPLGKSGEVFGLYATTGRVVSFLSPLAFGAAIMIGVAVTGQENTQYWGILGITLVIFAGLLVMIPVKEQSVPIAQD